MIQFCAVFADFARFLFENQEKIEKITTLRMAKDENGKAPWVVCIYLVTELPATLGCRKVSDTIPDALAAAMQDCRKYFEEQKNAN